MKKYIFLIIIACSSLLFAQQGQLIFKNYSTEDELAAPFVKTITQDKDGYIWCGTVNAIQSKKCSDGRSYDVGFSSPIYFSKCFRDEYGYSPSETVNKK